MKITFGETDGDCESNILQAIVGYFVAVNPPTDDREGYVESVDNEGISLVDDYKRPLVPRAHWRWDEIDELLIY